MSFWSITISSGSELWGEWLAANEVATSPIVAAFDMNVVTNTLSREEAIRTDVDLDHLSNRHEKLCNLLCSYFKRGSKYRWKAFCPGEP